MSKAESKNISHLGSKNGNGVPQNLINHIPPHNTFCTLFARHCGVFKNIKRANKVVINDLDPDVYKMWRDKFKHDVNVGIYSIDALAILESRRIGGYTIDFTSVFIYLDPPYKHSTRKAPQTSKYKHELTDQQHEALIGAVLAFKHAKIMISHYQCPEYDRLLESGWYKHSYPAMTHAGLVQETVYFNYPPPTVLHDYRYIGSNFREREAQKRIKVNLINKLDRLEPKLRNAIIADITSHYTARDDH